MFGKMLVLVIAGMMLADAALAQTMTREEFEKQLDADRENLKAVSREAGPMTWAKAQADFAFKLYLFDGAEAVTEAIGAYKSALEVYSSTATPAEWAKTEELLGVAYVRLSFFDTLVLTLSRGFGQADPTPELRDALQAFNAAQRVYTQAEFPRDWARLQLMEGTVRSSLALSLPDDNSERQEQHVAAVAAFNNVLQYVDAAADPFERAQAHRGLASMHAHGFVNDTERIRFALEHAKAAKADFAAAGEAQLAEGLERMISDLEYDLESAESYVPNELDSVFGAKRN
jgi:hypothetical protein